MPTFAAGPRGLLTLSLALVLCLGLFSGCATVSTELDKGYHALAQEEYYVRRQSKLWARPDRSSAERGFALKGDKVVKLEGDVRGWSRVKVEGREVEGWMPAASLSKNPVSPASSTPAASQPAASQPAAPAAAQPTPSQEKSGSIFSPPSAEAAEGPPKQNQTPPKRQADPKKFEPL